LDSITIGANAWVVRYTPLDIDGIDEILLLDRGLQHRAAAAYTGVVDQAVQSRTALTDRLYGSVNLILPGDVEPDGRDVVDRIQRGEILVLMRTGVDVVALARQRFGEVAANAGTGARDEYGFVARRRGGLRRREQKA
jgi:hypothetical protein